jgi:hypothetical protein
MMLVFAGHKSKISNAASGRADTGHPISGALIAGEGKRER